jgi:hypothetical protein
VFKRTVREGSAAATSASSGPAHQQQDPHPVSNGLLHRRQVSDAGPTATFTSVRVGALPLRRWCSGLLKSTASAHELANNAEQLNQLVGQFKTAA